MRSGLRLQILLLMGGLMLLSFLPLYYAAATYSAVTLKQLQRSHARVLGRALLGHAAEARRTSTRADLARMLQTELRPEGALAFGIYEPGGQLSLRVGEAGAIEQVPHYITPGQDRILELMTAQGPALGVLVTDPRGSLIALLRTDHDAARVKPLVGLLGLYTALVALALLVAAYSALTRLIVQPLDTLGRAAERVISGSRHFEAPQRGPLELLSLGASLKAMTDQLVKEERRLRQQVEAVNQAKEQLAQAQERLVRSERLASVGRLSAGLAHEVGNPLAALSAMLDLLLEGGLTPAEERDFLSRMRRDTERIHRIVRDLLQFSRPVARPSLELPACGLVCEALEDTIALLAPQKSMRAVELRTELATDLPPVALSREQMVQVFLNLLLNAGDACDGCGTVVVRGRQEQQRVVIEVEDTGPGVHPRVRPRLFEPFVTTKDVGEGTGLGLAVCRGIVENQGGTLELDPGYTAGARFRIELPVSAT